MTYDQLSKIMVNHNYSAASFASADPAFDRFSCINGFDFATPPVPFGDFANMAYSNFITAAMASNTILSEISARVFRTAAAISHYKSISLKEIKAGKQYPWHHVLKHMPKEDKQCHIAAMNIEISKLADAGHACCHKKLLPDVKQCKVFNPVGVFREKSHNMHNYQESVLKGRICVDSNSKAKEGCFRTSANVATAAQILSILALAVADGHKLIQMVVKSAFMQVKLEDSQSIWLQPLPGFPDEDHKGLYLELLHHLYGHPKANCAWMHYWVHTYIKVHAASARRQRNPVPTI